MPQAVFTLPEPRAPRYSRQLVTQWQDGGTCPGLVCFWGHQPDKQGILTPSCFSQWWASVFRDQGEDFCCMEQYMMLGKALLFGDTATAEKIRAASDPREIKALGRQVKPFDAQAWDAVKFPLVARGNLAKFSQDAALADFLLSTGDSVLIEASPYDRIWGVGLRESDERIRDARLWQGENLLGFALMEVRDALRAGAASL